MPHRLGHPAVGADAVLVRSPRPGQEVDAFWSEALRWPQVRDQEEETNVGETAASQEVAVFPCRVGAVGLCPQRRGR
ncbi:hypothetical protein C6376_43210 [Streptomyces sp. P3]|nr:hypothetical protein C6376_43210 [Streptomyces sp. P3]